jgi:hypothetical protein
MEYVMKVKETYTIIITIEHTGLRPLLKFLLAHYPNTTVATYSEGPGQAKRTLRDKLKGD